MTKLDEPAVVSMPPSSEFTESAATQLAMVDEQLSHVQVLLGKWARAKFRGPQATTILSNEMSAQCEELMASAQNKLSQFNASF